MARLDTHHNSLCLQTTVAELEDAWSSSHDEWGLLGPVVDSTSPLFFVLEDVEDGDDSAAPGFLLERRDPETGEQYRAIDYKSFDLADVRGMLATDEMDAFLVEYAYRLGEKAALLALGDREWVEEVFGRPPTAEEVDAFESAYAHTVETALSVWPDAV